MFNSFEPTEPTLLEEDSLRFHILLIQAEEIGGFSKDLNASEADAVKVIDELISNMSGAPWASMQQVLIGSWLKDDGICYAPKTSLT